MNTSSKDRKVPNSNQWRDVWVIEKQLLNENYKNNYQANNLAFSEKEGVKYFQRKTEIEALKDPQLVAKYRKIEVGEDVKYVIEGEKKYYTKIYNNDRNHNNYIIVDEYGNMLTKPVTAPQIFKYPSGDAVNTERENKTFKSKSTSIFSAASDAPLLEYWNTYTRYPNGTEDTPNFETKPREIPTDMGTITGGKYRGQDKARANKDYRIPAFERVYLESTFNLNEDSYYSYFKIKELERINYGYLNKNENADFKDGKLLPGNVDDMFFTYIRAEWID